MAATIYLNLEDDVSKIVTRIKREKAAEVTLVCPKRSYLFNDSINLRLLKKQVDMLGKQVSILTMDERGQMYAKEAGFSLKFLPKAAGPSRFSDVRVPARPAAAPAIPEKPKPTAKEENMLERAAGGLKSVVKNIASPVLASPKLQVSEAPASRPAPTRLSEASDMEPEGLDAKARAGLQPRRGHRGIMAAVALSLLVILAVVFVVLPKADVAVYAKSEPITRDLDINIASALKEPSVSKLQLPAIKVSEILETKAKFQSQGKREVGNKAFGTVRIYNFTRAPLNLKASTTQLSIGNKTYVLKKDITGLKPTVYKNAKTKEIDESSLAEPVEVVAASGGEGFNVPAGNRMEITNQVFGSNPQFLYAYTETPITGGTSRFISYVSEQDISNAQSQLGQQLLADYQMRLKSQELVLLDKAYTTETVGFAADKQAGTETPSFEASLKVKVTGLAYDRTSLENLVRERISQTLANSRTLKMDESEMIPKISSMDMGTEVAVVSVHFEGKAVLDVDLDNIAPELAGKSKDQVNEILRSKAEIEKIEVVLAPSWQQNFPWFASKISVKVVE